MKSPISRNRQDLLKHGLSFLASLAIHAILLYFLAAHFVSVKIIDFKEQVTDIIIAPRPKLEAPKIEGPLPELPRGEADLLLGIPSRRPAAPLAEVVGERIAVAQETGEAPGAPPVEAKFTEGFRLDRTSEEQDPATRDRLRLTVPERQTPAIPDRPAYLSGSRAGDLRKYVHGRPPGTPGSVGASGPARLSRGTPSQVRVVPPSVLKIDLSFWARSVVDLIQKNWNVPPEPASGSTAAVEIVAVILKSGEIASVEIAAASEDRAFNLAAREAVEMSSPLPRLPDGFPAASLEVSLIFIKQ